MNKDPSLVAVVDDEESVRKALGRLIRSAGYGVEMFGSGVEFMQSLKRTRPDCVVMDLRMPVLSGFELQSALQRSGVTVPVVIITGDDAADSRERALRCGARAFLRKPVDEALLIEAIQNAVRDPA
ncbi:response regulator [Ramlibacter ginsenosidimutans]|uniref:Response regulator n=1 Tax=Ramlibacter ginsenosidimutans TaxID=502333 RepID=A0A934U1Q0_9BURK|nr:response regulator [Ramlibacter ginsenosidimutans]MBK6009307.1 response regulator [Ramlibacter ginsenosidimutans]